MGHSFAANRNEGPADVVSAHELVHMLVDVVSKNGNLLIEVGPLPDGSIPREQQEPLRALGRWLHVNGSAIRSSRRWDLPSAPAGDGTPLRFTSSGSTRAGSTRVGGDVNVITLGTPTTRCLHLPSVAAGLGARALLVATGQELELSGGGTGGGGDHNHGRDDDVRIQLSDRCRSPRHT